MPENRNQKGACPCERDFDNECLLGHIRNDWTKAYVRLLGVSWLMLGVPWLVFNRIAVHTAANIGTGLLCIILLALAMPSIVFTFFIDKKYRNILKNE